MKTVNLVPGWYQRQQRRRKNLRLHVGFMLLLGALMIAARVVGQQRLAVLNARRGTLQQALAATPSHDAQLKEQQANLHRLQDLQLARRELGNTVPMSAVIQQLQNDMTPGMALSNVLIDVRSEPVKGSGVVGDTRNPPRYHDVAHLTVVGIAPNDRQVAQLIDMISKNQLFSDVTLDFTRTGTLHNYPVRKFEIQLGMDLEPLTTQTVDADASPAPQAGMRTQAPRQMGGSGDGE